MANRGGRGSGGRKRSRGRPSGRRPSGRRQGRARPSGSRLAIQPVEGVGFEIVHPPCVEEVQLDYEEALAAWQAGEPEEARDMLRFALEGCRDNLWIHAALGRLALEEMKDLELARGHLGYGYELALRAFPSGFDGPLPPDREANRPFFELLDGLIACAEGQGRSREAAGLRNRRQRLTETSR